MRETITITPDEQRSQQATYYSARQSQEDPLATCFCEGLQIKMSESNDGCIAAEVCPCLEVLAPPPTSIDDWYDDDPQDDPALKSYEESCLC